MDAVYRRSIQRMRQRRCRPDCDISRRRELSGSLAGTVEWRHGAFDDVPSEASAACTYECDEVSRESSAVEGSRAKAERHCDDLNQLRRIMRSAKEILFGYDEIVRPKNTRLSSVGAYDFNESGGSTGSACSDDDGVPAAMAYGHDRLSPLARLGSRSSVPKSLDNGFNGSHRRVRCRGRVMALPGPRQSSRRCLVFPTCRPSGSDWNLAISRWKATSIFVSSAA